MEGRLTNVGEMTLELRNEKNSDSHTKEHLHLHEGEAWSRRISSHRIIYTSIFIYIYGVHAAPLECRDSNNCDKPGGYDKVSNRHGHKESASQPFVSPCD